MNRPSGWLALGVVVGVVAWAMLDNTRPSIGFELAGRATVFEDGVSAFSSPIPSLTPEERRQFLIGNKLFNDTWVPAPASTSSRDGLGPTFNATSCSACHFRDGRGSPPDEDPSALGLLLRISREEGSVWVPSAALGTQLQDNSIYGVESEGSISVSYNAFPVVRANGEVRNLAQPHYEIIGSPFEFEPDLFLSPRLAPQIAGVGLLEAIAEETILARADPDDLDDDGISGRPNYVPDLETGSHLLGRFGWKANTATVEQQTIQAFAEDIGITSRLLPNPNCPAPQVVCGQAPGGGDPELDDDRLDRIVFYSLTLAVPARRQADSSLVAKGEEVFFELGCESCHTATLVTGSGVVDQLSGQTIHAFTDLLLHDMGPGLADGRPDFEASGSEWRTAPLWGLGLLETVNGTARFLHDGRARTLD